MCSPEEVSTFVDAWVAEAEYSKMKNFINAMGEQTKFGGAQTA